MDIVVWVARESNSHSDLKSFGIRSLAFCILDFPTDPILQALAFYISSGSLPFLWALFGRGRGCTRRDSRLLGDFGGKIGFSDTRVFESLMRSSESIFLLFPFVDESGIFFSWMPNSVPCHLVFFKCYFPLAIIIIHVTV